MKIVGHQLVFDTFATSSGEQTVESMSNPVPEEVEFLMRGSDMEDVGERHAIRSTAVIPVCRIDCYHQSTHPEYIKITTTTDYGFYTKAPLEELINLLEPFNFK